MRPPPTPVQRIRAHSARRVLAGLRRRARRWVRETGYSVTVSHVERSFIGVHLHGFLPSRGRPRRLLLVSGAQHRVVVPIDVAGSTFRAALPLHDLGALAPGRRWRIMLIDHWGRRAPLAPSTGLSMPWSVLAVGDDDLSRVRVQTNAAGRVVVTAVPLPRAT